MKLIVTHHHPDVDAVTAAWLIKTFLPGWQEADVAFVPAGETYKNQTVDSDPQIIHVDTGKGRFDHHQRKERTCAARLVFEYLRESKVKTENLKVGEEQLKNSSKTALPWHEEALDRLTKVVVDIDHFGHINWPDPTSDIYDFSLESMLDGWHLLWRERDKDRQIIEEGFKVLDGIYQSFINKIWAEHELAEKAIIFKTKTGKFLAIETINDDTVALAQKKGYQLAVRKDPKKGYVRIKARPDSNLDLTPLYQALKKADPEATWYLHISRLMILNGSTKNPKMKATSLSLSKIIDIIKEVTGI